ncbi:MAG: CPBP family intramembrane glutamate endopeptidase, partial [Cyanobacteria bacterium P01_A01_bin.114]
MSLGSLVRRKFVGCLACVCLLIAVGLGLTGQGVSQPTQRSSYDVFSQLPFGLPMSQVAPTPEHYQPVADWVGRLILPQQREVQAQPGDWVWFEVLHAPIGGWVGKTMTLTWQTTPALDSYVSLVARDITFRDETEISQQQGNVHPARLDGWRQVGPLQSLAGARPHDDVLVALSGVQFRGGETLTIDQPPTQIAERFYGLVKFDASVPGDTACQSTCQGFRVRHYRPETRQFDGASETVYLPELPAINGLQQFSFAQIENSPAGEAGWYIYGSPNARGQFVVRAIAPRALFELQARQTITDRDAGLNYINFGNWRKTRDRKGTLNTVQLGKPDWQEGDQGLVLHIFGGIGGEQGEPPPIVATVTGHFSYGIATVVRDRLTQDLRFDIDYHQIYAHNPNGIVAGKLSWAEYMGNLQRGWLGTRPVSDVIIKLEALTETYRGNPVEAQASAQPGKKPVTFSINPLATLQQQLQIMAARYRTGDGTGAAVVTPAQSCIQDSSQALYETIQLIEAQVRDLPTADRSLWLSP